MIGLDPEFNIRNVATGESKSAHLVWPEKERYYFSYGKAAPSTKGGDQLGSEVERDGAAVEIRNLAPTNCRDNFIPYFAAGMKKVQAHVEKNFVGYTLASDSVYTLEEDSLVDAPEDVYEAGCRPDYDAYALVEKVASCMGNVRFTGGHLHYSTSSGWDLEKQAATAIAMDYMIGLPLVAILGDRFTVEEKRRRSVYGQAGSYRYDGKKIEYRTPSSKAFISPVLLSWATGMMRAMSLTSWSKTELKDRLFPVLGPQGVREIIDNHDVAGARMFYNNIIKAAPQYVEDETCLEYSLSGGGGSTYNPHFFMRAVDVLVACNDNGLVWPDDLKANWGLYDGYDPEHHQYWGIHGALAGQMDELIFPQLPVLGEVIPNFKPSHDGFVYTHPLNGGRKKYLSAAAKGWLL